MTEHVIADPPAEPAPSADAQRLLRIDGLSVATGAGADEDCAHPLQGVSIDIARGSLVGLVGESGSGKSMTSMAILGMLPPGLRVTAGSIDFDGRDLLALSEKQLRAVRGEAISIVFQNPKSSLNPVMKVGEQIAELMRIHEGLSKQRARAAAVELLDAMGIPNAAKRAQDYPHQYSGGMAQRAALARAMACSPKLLIADEPTTGLDATVQEEVLDLLVRSVRERDASLLLVSHDMRVIRATCDRTIVMYAGMVLESGPTDAVLGTPRSPYTQALVDCFEVTARGRVNSIPGAAPMVLEAHVGCPFAPRCTLAEERCRESVPQLEQREGRWVACHVR
ncbi:MAG TPA: ABC transporter ATP-binding protein [Conexibacter sp.]|nr:ABC transporter ATP-binding protein [Conexibacter sp.]